MTAAAAVTAIMAPVTAVTTALALAPVLDLAPVTIITLNAIAVVVRLLSSHTDDNSFDVA
jgi:hypothetical protein